MIENISLAGSGTDDQLLLHWFHVLYGGRVSTSLPGGGGTSITGRGYCGQGYHLWLGQDWASPGRT